MYDYFPTVCVYVRVPPLTYHISWRMPKHERCGRLYEHARYTSVFRRRGSSCVTKIKMYASRTRGEPTSGEVGVCPINHFPLKISSSTLGLREEAICERIAVPRAIFTRDDVFYYGCYRKENLHARINDGDMTWFFPSHKFELRSHRVFSVYLWRKKKLPIICITGWR